MIKERPNLFLLTFVEFNEPKLIGNADLEGETQTFSQDAFVFWH